MIGRLGLGLCALLLLPFLQFACSARPVPEMNLSAAPGVLVYVRDVNWPISRVQVTDQHGCVEYTLGNGRVWFETSEPLVLTFERESYAKTTGRFEAGRWYIVQMQQSRKAD